EATVGFGQHLVVKFATLRSQRDAALFDFTKTHAQFAGANGAVGKLEHALFIKGSEGGLAQQNVWTVPGRWALDLVDHSDAQGFHTVVEGIDVQQSRCEVVDVGAGDATDVGGNGRDFFELLVPGIIYGIIREFEGPGRQFQQTGCRSLFQTTLLGGLICQRQQFFWEQFAVANEFLESLLLIGTEEARIVRGQHRGEDAEGVFSQFVGVDWTEGGGDDRHGGSRSITQIVEAHRIHAKGSVDACDLRHFLW